MLARIGRKSFCELMPTAKAVSFSVTYYSCSVWILVSPFLLEKFRFKNGGLYVVSSLCMFALLEIRFSGLGQGERKNGWQ